MVASYEMSAVSAFTRCRRSLHRRVAAASNNVVPGFEMSAFGDWLSHLHGVFGMLLGDHYRLVVLLSGLPFALLCFGDEFRESGVVANGFQIIILPHVA